MRITRLWVQLPVALPECVTITAGQESIAFYWMLSSSVEFFQDVNGALAVTLSMLFHLLPYLVMYNAH